MGARRVTRAEFASLQPGDRIRLIEGHLAPRAAGGVWVVIAPAVAGAIGVMHLRREHDGATGTARTPSMWERVMPPAAPPAPAPARRAPR